MPEPVAGTIREVFLAFLKLGLTAFGGPVAHLGYFREAFVARRRWIDEAGYADLVALCQFLPGPASSQVGFALGTLRAGSLWGGLAAFAGFTLPSALILVVFIVLDKLLEFFLVVFVIGLVTAAGFGLGLRIFVVLVVLVVLVVAASLASWTD